MLTCGEPHSYRTTEDISWKDARAQVLRCLLSTRKPPVSYRSLGGYMSRTADRKNVGRWCQDPPRTTLYCTAEGPVGFRVASCIYLNNSGRTNVPSIPIHFPPCKTVCTGSFRHHNCLPARGLGMRFPGNPAPD
jgi:hypothetical protein